MSNGIRTRKGAFAIIFAPHHEFQIGFSVPKRIFAKAHERNRVKRVLREASATLLCQYDELPKAALIVKCGSNKNSAITSKSATDSIGPLLLEVRNTINAQAH